MKKKLSIALIAWMAAACSPKDPLELVYQDENQLFTGLAVSQEGRLFVNYPHWELEKKYSVIEVQNKKTVPYPDSTMNSWQIGLPAKDRWICVQALYIDANDRMYVVDPAAPFLGDVYEQAYKLVVIDLKTNQIIKTYSFEGLLPEDVYINDVQIDLSHNFAYLSNSKTGGIIALNLTTGATKWWLSQYAMGKSDPQYDFRPAKGTTWTNASAEPVRVHTDGIAYSAADDVLFFKSLTDNLLYSIPASWLRDFNVAQEEVAHQVVHYGAVSTSDGMIIDKKGRLYLGDLENNRIVVFHPKTREKTILIEDERLQWVDSFALHENKLYFTCSQIHHLPSFNAGKSTRQLPYQLFSIKID